MKTTRYFSVLLGAALAASLLTACGGGGYSSGAASVPTAGISITSGNALTIAQEIVGGANLLTGVSEGTNVLSGITISSAPGTTFSYADVAKQVLQQFPTLASQAGSVTLTGIVITPFQVSCTYGGTATISGTVSDQTYVTVNDSLTVSMINCSESTGIVMNGTMAMTVTAVSPLLDVSFTAPYNLTLATQLSNFTVNDNGTLFTSQGDLTIALAENTSGDMNTVLSGNSLFSLVGGVSELLTNYNLDSTFNNITLDFSMDASGTLASTALGGAVMFDTPTPFTGNDNTTVNPSAGEMEITTTKDGSNALVQAQTDGLTVLIYVDENGDTVWDTTITTDWNTLSP